MQAQAVTVGFSNHEFNEFCYQVLDLLFSVTCTFKLKIEEMVIQVHKYKKNFERGAFVKYHIANDDVGIFNRS